MGRVPLETALSLILLAVAGADGTLSDDERAALSEYLAGIVQSLGSHHDPARVLDFAMRHLDDEELFGESVAILGEHLSQAFLARVLSDATEIASADGLDSGEDDVINRLIGPGKWSAPRATPRTRRQAKSPTTKRSTRSRQGRNGFEGRESCSAIQPRA